MFGLGLPEVALILGILVLIFGARRLPEIGSGMGKAIKNFKAGVSGKDEIDVTPKPMSTAESLYLPAVFKGLGTTLRHLFQNVGRDGKVKKNIWVVQYPEEKRDDRPVVEGGQERSNFRGGLTKSEQLASPLVPLLIRPTNGGSTLSAPISRAISRQNTPK